MAIAVFTRGVVRILASIPACILLVIAVGGGGFFLARKLDDSKLERSHLQTTIDPSRSMA